MGDDIEFNPFYGVFPYRNFLEREGIPVVEAYAVDCHTIPVEPWERLGGLGTYVHLAGRGDYLSAYVVEIPPGGQLNPEQHMHDELMHVISGRGATVIEGADGRKHTFEWGPSAIFGVPLNAKHQIFNGSGTEPARLAAVTDLPIIMNIFHNPDFIYANPFSFAERAGEQRYFEGEGEFREVKPGRHQWETNFVPELVNFELPPWVARGAAGNNIQFLLGDSSMHCHISQFFMGTYKKAHAHNAGAHIFCVTGEGYSLLWREGENPVDTVRVDWKPGTLYAPPDGPTFHQHFKRLAPAVALPRVRFRRVALPRARLEDVDLREHGRVGQGGRHADRVRGRGPPHPRVVHPGVKPTGARVAHGRVHPEPSLAVRPGRPRADFAPDGSVVPMRMQIASGEVTAAVACKPRQRLE